MFTTWVEDFEAEAARRAELGDPEWTVGARMHPAVVSSVQRFQVGEAGDGANLIAKSGTGAYGGAVRLFVAEEQNHARLLENLLRAAGRPTIGGHWTDAVFVRLRRALGLRLELMVLLIAEVVALRYYRALRDGTDDPLTTEVAGRILADEQRHVPFHCDRLGAVPWLARVVWWVLFAGAVVTVAYDHGPALKVLDVTRREFVLQTAALFQDVVRADPAPRGS
ncbi:ferritin-like domain-containing protein [Lentzea tibetensis]|uniref:Ferritin-like domain-containing protein n=1 Tax=Lentzea tibetensis TaxID=2591470 RepID=A0A563EPF8_9PSEU|nr:ferritin-like domain-containing protein [Lentzea tibetensis]TWP49095.1 ferritin-like domain-containing protein [Lentzea tibetensis]